MRCFHENTLDTSCDMAKESPSSIALEALIDHTLLLEVEDLNVWDFVNETVKPFKINAIKA